MTKRISLLITQVRFLDGDLKLAPLNRIVYNSKQEAWYNVNQALDWDIHNKVENPEETQPLKDTLETLILKAPARFKPKALFGVFRNTDKDNTHSVAFRRTKINDVT